MKNCGKGAGKLPKEGGLEESNLSRTMNPTLVEPQTHNLLWERATRRRMELRKQILLHPPSAPCREPRWGHRKCEPARSALKPRPESNRFRPTRCSTLPSGIW